MSRRTIEGAYARLQGLAASSITGTSTLPRDFGRDYSAILELLRTEIDDEFIGFDLTQDAEFNTNNKQHTYHRNSLISKINQLKMYLESVHRASDRIVEIGSAYNLIRDEDLKSRCSDLLSASGHFDRVINQATLVLEDRIKQKLPKFSSMTGEPLVGATMKQEPSESYLVFSEEKSEQHGYVSLFRGVVGAFRNPSHHRFLNHITREQALQICAFIDNLLHLLENAETQSLD